MKATAARAPQTTPAPTSNAAPTSGGPKPTEAADEAKVLRGAAAAVAKNMSASLAIRPRPRSAPFRPS